MIKRQQLGIAISIMLAIHASALAQLTQKDKTLTGEWKMGSSVVTINQNSANITATFKTVAPTAKLYKPGDTAFTGRLAGTKITGKFELRQKGENGKIDTLKTAIELTLLPGGTKLKGRFKDRQYNKTKNQWTEKSRWLNLMLTRKEKATPRFVQKTEHLGLDLDGTKGTFTEVQKLVEGRPYWIELQFEQAPEGATRSVSVTVGGVKEEVSVLRAGDEGKRYRSTRPFLFEEQIEIPPQEFPAVAKSKSKLHTVERTPIDWFHGSWSVSYFDQNLGKVHGVAKVSPQSDGAVKVEMTLRHPEQENLHYTLVSTKSELKGSTLKVTLTDHSPSSARMITGHDHAKNVRDAASHYVASGDEITAKYGDKQAKASFEPSETAEDKSLDIALTFDLSKKSDNLVPHWSIAFDPQTGFKGRRHGRLELEKWAMVGRESWKRSGIQIDKVASLDKLDNAKWRKSAGSLIDGKTITDIWLRVEGRGLKFKSNEDLQIVFEDKAIQYTGEHRPDKENPDALNIQVSLNRNLVPEDKAFTLNEAPGTWVFNPAGLKPMVQFVRQINGNTFRPVRKLYQGEMFLVEARYKSRPYFKETKLEFEVKGGATRTLALVRSPDDPKAYHSQALLLPGNPEAYEAVFGDAKGSAVKVPKDAIQIKAQKGSVLIAKFEDMKNRRPTQSEIGIAEVLGMPSNEWIKALELAEKCYRNSNISIKNKAVKGYTLSNFIFTEMKTRTLTITLRDHAALLLIRDYTIKALEKKISQMNRVNPISQIKDLDKRNVAITRQANGNMQFAKALIRKASSGQWHPLFTMEVSNPKATDTLKLNEALRQSYLKKQFVLDYKNINKHKPNKIHGTLSRNKQADRHDNTDPKKSNMNTALIKKARAWKAKIEEKRLIYARRVISEAEGKMLGYAMYSLNRLRETGDCDIENLLQRCGMGFGNIGEFVKDKLLIPANDKSGRLVPDQNGYASINKIATLYQAMEAQRKYARLDKDMAVFIATSPFLFASVSASVAGGMLSAASYASTIASVSTGVMVVSDMIETGLVASDSYQYMQLRDHEIDFRKGMVPVAGAEGLNKIEAEATELYWRSVLGGGAIGLGNAVGIGAGIVAKRMAKANIEVLEDAVVQATRKGMDSLTSAQHVALTDAGLWNVLSRSGRNVEVADKILANLAHQKEVLRRGAKAMASKKGAKIKTPIGDLAETVRMPNSKTPVGEVAETVRMPGPKGSTGDLVDTVRTKGSTGELVDTVRTKGSTGDLVETVRTKGSTGDLVETVRTKGSTGELVETVRTKGSTGELVDTVRTKGSTGDLVDTVRTKGSTGDLVDTVRTKGSTGVGDDLTKTTILPHPPKSGDDLTKTLPPPGPRGPKGVGDDAGTMIYNTPRKPRPSHAPQPDVPALSVSEAMPPMRLDTPSAPPSPGSMWTAPSGKKIKIGDKLGEGTFSDVFAMADDPNKVIKFVKRGEGGEAGLNAWEIAADSKAASDLLGDDIPQVKVLEFNDSGAQPYVIVERVDPKTMQMLDLDDFPASKRQELIASGQWSTEHETAVIELLDKMAKKGLIWEDCHLGNMFFKKVDGKLVAGVLDHGRIGQWGKLNKSMKKWKKGLEELGPFNVPGESPGFIKSNSGAPASYQFSSPQEFMAKMLEHKRWIIYDKKTGQFLPYRIDPANIDPNIFPLKKWVQHKPRGSSLLPDRLRPWPLRLTWTGGFAPFAINGSIPHNHACFKLKYPYRKKVA